MPERWLILMDPVAAGASPRMMRLPSALTLVEPAAGFAASFWGADVVVAVVICVVLAALGRAAAAASGARARAVAAQTAALVLPM